MERRLFVLMTIGAVASVAFGAAMVVAAPAYLMMGWLRVKLVLVLVLIAYHGFCYRLMRDFAQGRNTHSARWYRVFNEVPSLLLIAIVVLAVVKPLRSCARPAISRHQSGYGGRPSGNNHLPSSCSART